MSIRVLASPEAATAFALAGLRGRAVEGRTELLSALDEAVEHEEIKVLAIEEGLAAEAREEIDRLKLDPAAPLVVEVPGLRGPAKEQRTALDLVRQALGIQL